MSAAQDGCVCHQGRDAVARCPHHTEADYDAQQWVRAKRGAPDQDDRAERAEGELYRLRCHAAMLADHVRGLVNESDRVEREGDEVDWTRPLIDMPVRKALERLMGTLAHLTEHWDSYPPSERERTS